MVNITNFAKYKVNFAKYKINVAKYKIRFSCHYVENFCFQLHFHGKNYKELQDYIDVEHLPSDYGGKGPPYTNQVLH